MTVLDLLKYIATASVSVVAAYVVLSSTYFLLSLIVAACARSSSARRQLILPAITRFRILIPAHDEEIVIARTLEGIQRLNYPAGLFETVLIADNCTDRTASIAEGYPRVTVIERTSQGDRGKGYALNWAVERYASDTTFDAFVVVDADTHVDQEFLSQMDSARQRFAPKAFVAQGLYDVLNPEESWRTALMAGALSLVHVVRPSAKEFFGLTTGLKGNGMCFDRSLVVEVPWRGESLAEDIEQTLDLLELKDVRVAFIPGARVSALMPSGATGAASQRKRWENGRSSIVKRRTAALLSKGFSQLNFLYIDAGLDLLAPPLAQLIQSLAVFIVCVVALGLLGGDWKLFGALAAFSLLSILLYVIVGFVVGGAPKLAYKALAFAPAYIFWKAVLQLRKRGSEDATWIRTEREQTEFVGTSSLEVKSANDNNEPSTILTSSIEVKN